MSRSSARRAQVEPLPALVAVTVVCLAVGSYATVRADVGFGTGGTEPADAVLDEVIDAASPPGSAVVDPTELESSTSVPSGYEVSVTIRTTDHGWTVGPSSPPPDAATASRRVPVRIEPGVVRPGRITVEVWS